MRKRILFIIGNLGEGGVSKSIVNLMNLIDRQRYDVTLFVCHSGGILMPLLPEGLKILTNPTTDALLSGFDGVKRLIRMSETLKAVGSLTRMALSKVSKSMAGRLLARLMPPLDEEFDVAVDYNGQHQFYWMVDKVNAQRKLTFFHSDYAKWPYYYKADRRYMPEADGIFTISETCAESLRRYFPAEKDKIGIVPNLSSPEMIRNFAGEEAPEMEIEGIRFITVGHLSHMKGTDLALRAASLLKQRGIGFHWFFIGKSSGDADYAAMARELGVADNVTFLGLRVNPYAYIGRADIFVHPSLFEGKSIALDEARILARPVVVTNFSTVADQFTDRVDASVVEMNPESIADAIQELLSTPELRDSYIKALSSYLPDNSAELANIYNILDR